MKYSPLICILLFLLSLQVVAQEEGLQSNSLFQLFQGTDPSLIQEALGPGLLVLRQDYKLATPAGQQFGRKGNPYFGRAYATAVAINGKWWAPSYLIHPWILDSAYLTYADSLIPIPQGIEAKGPNEQKFHPYSVFTEEEGKWVSWKDSSSLSYFSPNLTDSLPSTGRLILFFGQEKDSSLVQTKITRLYRLKWDSTRMARIQLPSTPGLLMGGALFREKISMGKVVWEPLAVYCNTKHGWALVGLPHFAPTPKEAVEKLVPETEPLTSSKKKRRKKKKRRRQKKEKS